MTLTNKLLSGIEINQNNAAATINPGAGTVTQELHLPSNFIRGANADEQYLPELTGFSIMIGVNAGVEDITAIDWTLDRYLIGTGWIPLSTGTTVGAQAANSKIWFDVYFDTPLTLDYGALDADFRITITGRVNGGRIHEVVDYADGIVQLDNNAISVPDLKSAPYLFTYDGYPAILTYDSTTSEALFSQQQGPSAIWYGNLSETTYATATTISGDITSVAGVASPLTFRLLTATADSGRDLFGDPFRHALYTHSVGNVTTVDGGREDAYWLSKPNPSAFAIENQYFDLTQDGAASVVDALLLDPITPDVYFSIYYTSEGDPGTTPDEWDAKLWTRVTKTFQAKRRDTYVLPRPFTAKYAKIEYTHLQPRTYRPGPFQQPIKYRKHPKWVLDYFLLRLANTQANQSKFVPSVSTLEYDALDLAYNYYLDDLNQAPEVPVQYDSTKQDALATFFQNNVDSSDHVDLATLDKINYATNPYKQALFSGADSLLSELVGGNTILATETGSDLFRDLSSDVSSLNRDAVIFEQTYPVMFFYLTCRHFYREVQATPTYDRAYFVGIREIAWMREQYTKATDTNLYVEVGGDSVNLQSNDFVHDETSLVIGNG